MNETKMSALGRAIKRSLNMEWRNKSEALGWYQDGKDLENEYKKLVSLHDQIEKSIKEEWKGLYEKFDELKEKMIEWEASQVPEGKRKERKEEITTEIKRTEELLVAVKNEPGRLEEEEKKQTLLQEKWKKLKITAEKTRDDKSSVEDSIKDEMETVYKARAEVGTLVLETNLLAEKKSLTEEALGKVEEGIKSVDAAITNVKLLVQQREQTKLQELWKELRKKIESDGKDPPTVDQANSEELKLVSEASQKLVEGILVTDRLAEEKSLTKEALDKVEVLLANVKKSILTSQSLVKKRLEQETQELQKKEAEKLLKKRWAELSSLPEVSQKDLPTIENAYKSDMKPVNEARILVAKAASDCKRLESKGSLTEEVLKLLEDALGKVEKQISIVTLSVAKRVFDEEFHKLNTKCDKIFKQWTTPLPEGLMPLQLAWNEAKHFSETPERNHKEGPLHLEKLTKALEIEVPEDFATVVKKFDETVKSCPLPERELLGQYRLQAMQEKDLKKGRDLLHEWQVKASDFKERFILSRTESGYSTVAEQAEKFIKSSPKTKESEELRVKLLEEGQVKREPFGLGDLKTLAIQLEKLLQQFQERKSTFGTKISQVEEKHKLVLNDMPAVKEPKSALVQKLNGLVAEVRQKASLDLVLGIEEADKLLKSSDEVHGVVKKWQEVWEVAKKTPKIVAQNVQDALDLFIPVVSKQISEWALDGNVDAQLQNLSKIVAYAKPLGEYTELMKQVHSQAPQIPLNAIKEMAKIAESHVIGLEFDKAQDQYVELIPILREFKAYSQKFISISGIVGSAKNLVPSLGKYFDETASIANESTKPTATLFIDQSLAIEKFKELTADAKKYRQALDEVNKEFGLLKNMHPASGEEFTRATKANEEIEAAIKDASRLADEEHKYADAQSALQKLAVSLKEERTKRTLAVNQDMKSRLDKTSEEVLFGKLENLKNNDGHDLTAALYEQFGADGLANFLKGLGTLNGDDDKSKMAQAIQKLSTTIGASGVKALCGELGENIDKGSQSIGKLMNNGVSGEALGKVHASFSGTKGSLNEFFDQVFVKDEKQFALMLNDGCQGDPKKFKELHEAFETNLTDLKTIQDALGDKAGECIRQLRDNRFKGNAKKLKEQFFDELDGLASELELMEEFDDTGTPLQKQQKSEATHQSHLDIEELIKNAVTFSGTALPSTLPVPDNLSAYKVSEVNMEHFLKRHTRDYFCFNPSDQDGMKSELEPDIALRKKNSMWPEGTTPKLLAHYLGCSLKQLADDNQLPDVETMASKEEINRKITVVVPGETVTFTLKAEGSVGKKTIKVVGFTATELGKSQYRQKAEEIAKSEKSWPDPEKLDTEMKLDVIIPDRRFRVQVGLKCVKKKETKTIKENGITTTKEEQIKTFKIGQFFPFDDSPDVTTIPFLDMHAIKKAMGY